MRFRKTATALALLFAGPAFAAPAVFMDQSSMDMTGANPSGLALYGSDLIGARVYIDDVEYERHDATVTEADRDWDDIGEIEELLVSRDGTIKGVVVGVGGFLGMGERDVAVTMESLSFVRDGDDVDDYFVVLQGDKATLEAAPEFTWPEEEITRRRIRDEMRVASREDMTSAEKMAQADGMTTPEAMTAERRAADSGVMFAPPMIERDGYTMAKFDELTADDLSGAAVYDTNDEHIGEINRLLLTNDGQINEAVIDVGGWLGMGEHPVAISMKEISIQREDNGNDLRVYVDATKEQLEALDAYK